MTRPKLKAQWFNGNDYTPFTTLFSLHKIDDSTYESAHPAFGPGNSTRAFGGHVYAQSALAASKSVPEGFVLHSITGHFLQLGFTNVPFTYTISPIRDGAGYVQRRVDVSQKRTKGLMFTAVCSFKRPEKSQATRTLDGRLEERYALLKGRGPESWAEAPSIDSPFWWEAAKEFGEDKFPGLDMRKVDMDAYNKDRMTLERRQLMFYRVLGDMPDAKEGPNLHAIAHLYASDRNGLFPIANFLGKGDEYSAIASLSFTVVLHAEAEELGLIDADGKAKWFCVELAIDHIGHGRGLMVERLWDVQSGKPVASTMQDGLLRLKPGIKQGLVGENTIFADNDKRLAKSEKL
ncbi:Thioesterase/thiol ester dehydrase-isomerase [Microthyrium microscopicum]|uniref:Thioesterase/thiol ester dehydrase-isomerase n=1 Tax=Microthyrium microscopicum TaxID=703497 RepID=A0A6A6UHW4_9PEZI|nr:Thioesterase/thiol ester dehydrase-isomerase [Microthyrium microscopicum]